MLAPMTAMLNRLPVLPRAHLYTACLSIALGLFCLFPAVPIVHAAQSSQTIAQGFPVSTSDAIVAGALVATAKGSTQTIEAASTDSTARLIGVIDTDPLVSISTGSKEAQVVLSGTTSVLVSDINGAITAGDKITASPIAGVGMRATADGSIVGTAQASFTAANGQARAIKDNRGKLHTVHIGYVQLQVGVAYYRAPGSDFLPPFIQRIADGIAGKPVSLIRITAASLLLLISFVGITVFVYTATHSAMISLGRNPLASKQILRGLYQAILVAAIAVIGTLLASYLILTV